MYSNPGGTIPHYTCLAFEGEGEKTKNYPKPPALKTTKNQMTIGIEAGVK
jgi:hypothetical protein